MTWNQKRARLATFAANCSDADTLAPIVAKQLGWGEHFARVALLAEMERISLGAREAEETERLRRAVCGDRELSDDLRTIQPTEVSPASPETA